MATRKIIQAANRMLAAITCQRLGFNACQGRVEFINTFFGSRGGPSGFFGMALPDQKSRKKQWER
jgi:hypothetical protein